MSRGSDQELARIKQQLTIVQLYVRIVTVRVASSLDLAVHVPQLTLLPSLLCWGGAYVSRVPLLPDDCAIVRSY